MFINVLAYIELLAYIAPAMLALTFYLLHTNSNFIEN